MRSHQIILQKAVFSVVVMWRRASVFMIAAFLVTTTCSQALAQGGKGDSGCGGCGGDRELFGSFGTLYNEQSKPIVVREDNDEYWYYDVLFPSLAEANKIEHWSDFEKRLGRVKAGRTVTPKKDQPVFGSTIPKIISEELFRKSFKPWLYRGAKDGSANWLYCQVTKDGDVKIFKPEIPDGKYYAKAKNEGYEALVPLGVEDLFFLFPPGAKKRIEQTDENTALLKPLWDYTLPDDIEGVVRYEVRLEGESEPRLSKKLKADTTYRVTVIQEFVR